MIVCDQQNRHYLEHYASKSAKFLSFYTWITDAYVSDFFYKHHWDRLPKSWRESLKSLSTKELSSSLLDKETVCSSHVLPLSLLCFKTCTQALSLDRQQHTDYEGALWSLFGQSGQNDHQTDAGNNHQEERDEQPVSGDGSTSDREDQMSLAAMADSGSLHAFLKKHVKPKKQHEILNLGKVINLLSRRVGCDHVVDVGAGLGHLSRLLSFGYGLDVTSVEASGTHAPKASKYDREVDREIKKKHEKKHNSSHTLPANPSIPSCSLPCHVTSMIEPNMTTQNFLNIIRAQQHTELGNSIWQQMVPSTSAQHYMEQSSSTQQHPELGISSRHHTDPGTRCQHSDVCTSAHAKQQAKQSVKSEDNGGSVAGVNRCPVSPKASEWTEAKPTSKTMYTETCDADHGSHKVTSKNIDMDTKEINHGDHEDVGTASVSPRCVGDICTNSSSNETTEHGRKRRDSDTLCEIEPKSPRLKDTLQEGAQSGSFEHGDELVLDTGTVSEPDRPINVDEKELQATDTISSFSKCFKSNSGKIKDVNTDISSVMINSEVIDKADDKKVEDFHKLPDAHVKTDKENDGALHEQSDTHQQSYRCGRVEQYSGALSEKVHSSESTDNCMENASALRLNQDVDGDEVDGMDVYEGNESRFILTGLHACGDLTPTFLRFFINCEAAQGLASVGCCYMKLSTGCHGEPVGYPMSGFVSTLPDHELSYNALELACHFADTYSKRLKECPSHLKIHSYRAALEWLANQISPNFQRTAVQIPSKKTNQMDFKAYANVGLTKLGLSANQVNPELLLMAEAMTDRWKDVVAFYTIRLSLAPVIETLVLIDRMLYLQENGHTSALVPIFDPGLSPRNFVLLSGKQGHLQSENQPDKGWKDTRL